MRTTFMSKASEQLSDIYFKHKAQDKPLDFLGDAHLAELHAHWEKQDFKKISKANKANRNSNARASIHTGGSNSTVEERRKTGHSLGGLQKKPSKKDRTWVSPYTQENVNNWENPFLVPLEGSNLATIVPMSRGGEDYVDNDDE
ncbi:hypothetical protein CDL15_Pgr012333 [Punica granatum]|uniref:Uncharacterized protein n=1 Tax=Punica granatum TaxID=22663 RepID=A0A218Y2Z3_PUNGR|nr:hypothetical protein CDL15_Pgr012333 [Punica granatum]